MRVNRFAAADWMSDGLELPLLLRCKNHWLLALLAGAAHPVARVEEGDEQHEGNQRHRAGGLKIIQDVYWSYTPKNDVFGATTLLLVFFATGFFVTLGAVLAAFLLLELAFFLTAIDAHYYTEILKIVHTFTTFKSF